MKKGFTLIEMIGSIVILAIIALVAFPAVLNMLNSSQGKVDSGMQDYVKGAASEYVNDHVNSYPRNAVDSTGKLINVSTLLSEGYLTSKAISDAMNNDQVKVTVKKNTISTISKDVYVYQYTYIEK